MVFIHTRAVRRRATSALAGLAVTWMTLGVSVSSIAGCAAGEEGNTDGAELENIASTQEGIALGAEEEACAQELIDLEREVLAVAAEARDAAPCHSDKDCTLIDPSIACLGMCPTAVPAGQAKQTAERVASLGGDACGGPRQCAVHATCPPIERATCVRGQCVPDLSAWTRR
jgi:hypothetical protein